MVDRTHEKSRTPERSRPRELVSGPLETENRRGLTFSEGKIQLGFAIFSHSDEGLCSREGMSLLRKAGSANHLYPATDAPIGQEQGQV